MFIYMIQVRQHFTAEGEAGGDILRRHGKHPNLECLEKSIW